uniref:L-2-hydroxyglutarate dehydrogenase, mitochondrial n=1 Tax=Blastobotrys adeninivorans TaxID=409370 RepID=A0A060T277_BLAAD
MSLAKRASDFSHIVVGGGVVGLAIAARLSARPSNSVLLVERHREVGTETSARNSEVIHAGINYAPDALRTTLCIKGKEMLYEAGRKYGIEMNNCGKWVVAQDDKQYQHLERMYARSRETGVPLEWLSPEKAKQMEPAVIARAGILNSPTTGIVSAHSVMSFLEGQIENNGADVALNTKVERVEYLGNSNGYIVSCENEGETMDLKADCVINAAGHGAVAVSNSVLPSDRQFTAYYLKGNYFSYNASRPKVSRLVYPCPSDHASLGTHLTLDLGGKIKFGPDVEWTDRHDDYKVSGKNLDPAIKEIQTYLQGIDPTALTPDYVGIRPKIVPTGKVFQDFYIKHEEGFPGFINLLNIESPGLTSCMAIAEHVEQLL